MKCSYAVCVPMIVAALLFLAADGRPVGADVKLPAVLGSHMVLQRNVPLPVWGTAEPGKAVRVDLDGNRAATKAGADGRWQVTLKAMSADGKTHRLTVRGNNTVVREDILIGEVWVGSGQSNMEWQLSNAHNAKQAIPIANHPQMRLFHVPKVQSKTPAADVKASWKACTPQNAPSFSAVLYFFGARLHKELKVPIGLVNSSWGGSPIEPWIVTKKGSGDMYNGMIAPLLPLPVRGTIWYQGDPEKRSGLSGKNARFDQRLAQGVEQR